MAKQLVPKIISKENIRRKIKNKPEFINTDMKIYEYKKANVSVNKINSFVQNIVKKLNEQGLDVKVKTTIKVPGLGWRSGRLTQNSAPIRSWTPAWGTNDQEGDNLEDWYKNGEGKVEDFDVFIQAVEKKKVKKGGRDENNDCLYNCLFSVLKETLTTVWKSARDLKKYLKIERTDMINCESHIDLIEKKLNIGIYIEGDVNRTPKIEAKTSIKVILSDNHYSTKKQKKQHEPYFSFDEKKPIFYHRCKETDVFYFYDGVCIREESHEQFIPRLSYKYKYSESVKSKYFYMKCAKKEELKTMYDEFIFNADQLKKITKGRINLYKTFTIKNTALKIFYDLIQHVEEPEQIDDKEAEFINGCYRGGLLFHNKYTGNVWKGDVCSMYPSIMSSKLMFPVKSGEFKTITQDDLLKMTDKRSGKQIYKCGIYRAVITSTDNSIDKLFHLNKNSYYTHVDMMQATKLNFSVEMIEDGDVNFLYYSPEKMLTGSSLFSHYVDFLFELKRKHPEVIFAKRILNILWGALCESRVSGQYDFSKEIILKENEEIVSIKKYDNGTRILHCEEIGNRFLSGFARIGPFITSHGRKMIGDLAIEHVSNLDSIQRIYTDCILSSERLRLTDKDSCKLGEFGLEEQNVRVEVVNAIKVIKLN